MRKGEGPISAFGRFHHLGIACRSIDASHQKWERLGYRREGNPFEDASQGIRGLFLVGGGPRIELLESLDGSSTLEPWLRKSSNIYHTAYEVGDLAWRLACLQEIGGIVVQNPASSVAFDGRSIAFVMIESGWLVELIEGDVIDERP